MGCAESTPASFNDRYGKSDFTLGGGILGGAAAMAAATMVLQLTAPPWGVAEPDALALVATCARLGFAGWTALFFCAHEMQVDMIPYDGRFDAMTRAEFEAAQPRRGVEARVWARWRALLPFVPLGSLCMSEVVHQHLPRSF